MIWAEPPMERFAECFSELPDPRADNSLHDLTEILFITQHTGPWFRQSVAPILGATKMSVVGWTRNSAICSSGKSKGSQGELAMA